MKGKKYSQDKLEEETWITYTTRSKYLSIGYSNRDSLVLAQRLTNRPLEHSRKINRPTIKWAFYYVKDNAVV